MAKPIIILKLSNEVLRDSSMTIANYQEIFEKKFSDYHVLCVPTYQLDVDPATVQVFNEKDFTEVQYEELKKIITDSLKENKNETI